MYRGYPIGYLLFWENGLPGEHRVMGMNKKQKAPSLLIVDGQQRLTALYAVIKGIPVVDKDYSKRPIRIAFHPQEQVFEVANPAIQRDPEWISDISLLWDPSSSHYRFVKDFIERLRKTRNISEQEVEIISDAIDRLYSLQSYPLTALEISSSVDEEQVADIFVRINSQGKSLNQADFILTLMSVVWDEGRAELERFCREAKKPSENNRPSSYNHYIQPSPDQLLRVSVALGFRRARLEHVYSLLRGKDLQTKVFSEEQRDRQFKFLREAQAYTLDLQNWHEFFKVIRMSGYPGSQLITSQLALVYTYALWLIGKRDFHVDPHRLRKALASWSFMVALTGRYTEGTESRMEQDLAMFRGLEDPEQFVEVLNRQIDAVLTEDYWEFTLTNDLATASARSTGQFAYYAALCLLDAQVLYSKMKVSELLDPSIRAPKAAIERHHLFPRKYLQSIGIGERRDINQVANYALVEWNDNVFISDRAPKLYALELEQRFSNEEIQRMYYWHALPEKWYEMGYFTFLEERRKRIAAVIREGFRKLREGS
jgi:hypothetical protein